MVMSGGGLRRVGEATVACDAARLNACMSPEVITVFFDFLCPYAWRVAELTEIVAVKLGTRFDWRHFSLYQSNYDGDDGWQLWNEPVEEASNSGSRGLLPFLASSAARRQGAESYDAFRLQLLRMRHVEQRPFHRVTVLEAADRAGLHRATFERDLGDPEMRTSLAREHHAAVAADVAATPTLLFPSGDAAYVRIAEVPRDETEALALFERVRSLLEEHPYVETIRRPRPARN